MAIRSKADPIQITQRTFEEDLDAIRVVMLPTEMEMNLSTESGDSIYAVAKMEVITAKAGDVIRTAEAKRMACYPASNVNAIILGEEFELGSIGSSPKEVCVPNVKIESDCMVVLQG